MLDFIIDFFMEVANFFTDLWINKIRAKKKITTRFQKIRNKSKGRHFFPAASFAGCGSFTWMNIVPAYALAGFGSAGCMLIWRKYIEPGVLTGYEQIIRKNQIWSAFLNPDSHVAFFSIGPCKVWNGNHSARGWFSAGR